MDYKSYFDIPNGITYLNTPGNGLLPRQHHAWRQQWENEFFDPKEDLRDRQAEFINSVKEVASRLFHCPSTNYYAVPNFSFGFNTLITGLSPGLKFALLNEDYPSVNYPVLSRGLEHVIITIDENLEDNIRHTLAKDHPDVLIFSLVNYITGIKIDLDFIKQLRLEYPDLIIIGDATQYLGTEPFDFSNSGFDAIGASGYKWLLAGFGNGLFFLSDRLKEKLYVQAQQGTRPKEAMWANKAILDTFFEPGHQDTLSHGTLKQSFTFLEELGLDHIRQQLQRVSQYTYEGLDHRGLLLPIIGKRKVRSPFINIQTTPELYPQLLAEGIKCFPRGTGIRIGIHLYNDEGDIDKLFKIIDRHI
jgi:selenocysteine lyase/cysteine desulfurase